MGVQRHTSDFLSLKVKFHLRFLLKFILLDLSVILQKCSHTVASAFVPCSCFLMSEGARLSALCLYACRQEEGGENWGERPGRKLRGLGRGEAAVWQLLSSTVSDGSKKLDVCWFLFSDATSTDCISLWKTWTHSKLPCLSFLFKYLKNMNTCIKCARIYTYLANSIYPFGFIESIHI